MKALLFALAATACAQPEPLVIPQGLLDPCPAAAPTPAPLPRLTTIDRLRDSRLAEREAREKDEARLRDCAHRFTALKDWIDQSVIGTR